MIVDSSLCFNSWLWLWVYVTICLKPLDLANGEHGVDYSLNWLTGSYDYFIYCQFSSCRICSLFLTGVVIIYTISSSILISSLSSFVEVLRTSIFIDFIVKPPVFNLADCKVLLLKLLLFIKFADYKVLLFMLGLGDIVFWFSSVMV